MNRILSILLVCFFLGTSFHSDVILDKNYTLVLEAKGCHYQVSLNGKVIEEGKTYSRVEKTIQLQKHLNDSIDQKINVLMSRISREMDLKTTQAYVGLRLDKGLGDSTEMIKEVKLPTFPYDEDPQQPQSIGGTIEFQLGVKN
ncbi:hypothetical protein [Moheibacter stercoris]|uniref:Uncharacterized protein n=1 Tax=Moheibacter stercoris TaxID=1628251 RepID=A0ABV2LWU3_9FLAO